MAKHQVLGLEFAYVDCGFPDDCTLFECSLVKPFLSADDVHWLLPWRYGLTGAREMTQLGHRKKSALTKLLTSPTIKLALKTGNHITFSLFLELPQVQTSNETFREVLVLKFTTVLYIFSSPQDFLSLQGVRETFSSVQRIEKFIS